MKNRVFMLLMAITMTIGLVQASFAATEEHEGISYFGTFEYGEAYYDFLYDEDGNLILDEDGSPLKSEVPSYTLEHDEITSSLGTVIGIRYDVPGYVFSGTSEFEDGSKVIWDFSATKKITDGEFDGLEYEGQGSIVYYGDGETISNDVTGKLYYNGYYYVIIMETEIIDGKNDFYLQAFPLKYYPG